MEHCKRKCLIETNNCFWKEPTYIKNKVKTRCQTENEPTVDYKTFNDYNTKREWNDRWLLGKEQKNN